jgi:hypothetical protein
MIREGLHRLAASTRRIPARHRWALLALFLGVLPCACSAPRFENLTLKVMDRETSQPVAGAIARLRPLKFYLPMGDSPSPTPGDFAGDQAESDAEGLVTLQGARNAPSELWISHPDFASWRGQVEPESGANGDAPWRIHELWSGEGGRALLVEISLVPSGER